MSVNRPDRQKIGTVGQPLPGVAVQIADDGEVLVRGKSIFPGYWRDETATKDAFTADGWYATGDLGELDDEGFLTITGRKKEIIVTAGGKNVAPAVLEDRMRMHALISQCMVVGDGRPFVGVLVTIDPEAFGPWKARHGKPADATVADLRDDPDLNAEIQAAVDDANKAVSRAESIKKFRILDGDFTQEQAATCRPSSASSARSSPRSSPPRSTRSTRSATGSRPRVPSARLRLTLAGPNARLARWKAAGRPGGSARSR